MSSTEHHLVPGKTRHAAGNPIKRQQILIAARELFFAFGYSAVAMEAVAKEARVGKATLYELFPGKIDLLRDIITQEVEIRADHLAFGPEGASLREKLANFGHALMDLLLSHSNVAIYRIISAEAPRHPELGQFFYDNGPSQVIGRVANFFTAAMEEGRLQPANPRLMATQFIGILRADLQTRAMFGVDPDLLNADRRICVETGVDAFLRAYGK